MSPPWQLSHVHPMMSHLDHHYSARFLREATLPTFLPHRLLLLILRLIIFSSPAHNGARHTQCISDLSHTTISNRGQKPFETKASLAWHCEVWRGWCTVLLLPQKHSNKHKNNKSRVFPEGIKLQMQHQEWWQKQFTNNECLANLASWQERPAFPQNIR